MKLNFIKKTFLPEEPSCDLPDRLAEGSQVSEAHQSLKVLQAATVRMEERQERSHNFVHLEEKRLDI